MATKKTTAKKSTKATANKTAPAKTAQATSSRRDYSASFRVADPEKMPTRGWNGDLAVWMGKHKSFTREDVQKAFAKADVHGSDLDAAKKVRLSFAWMASTGRIVPAGSK